MKFRTKPVTVDAVRITDSNVGTPGSWFIQADGQQRIVSNEEFVKTYSPGGRGAAKVAYEAAKAELAGPAAAPAEGQPTE